MGRFCTRCGTSMDRDAVFCISCGQKAVTSPDFHNASQIRGNNTRMIYAGEETAVKKKKPLWLMITISVIVLAVVVSAAAFGIWKILDTTGVLDEMALRKASGQWQRQEGFRTEEKEIETVIEGLAAKLQEKDIQGSLEYFHYSSKDEMELLFMDNRDKMPVLADILENFEITYLSEETGYYEGLRMARVIAGTPSEENPSSGVASLTLVKTEDGWVVDKLK